MLGDTMNMYCFVFFLLFSGVYTDTPKAFNNPLNAKSVDVFMAVDETNTHLTVLQLGFMKTAIHNIALELNPAGSSLSFGLFFYGASSVVDVVAPMVNSAAAVKAKLDLKPYTMTQSNPSTLTSALTTINSYCQSYCRPGVARVIIIVSSSPDISAESTIRELERSSGMTVILVGIGSSASQTVLNRLASSPSRYYAIPVASHAEFVLASGHIASMTSDVPLILGINNPLLITSVFNGIYYTVQINTYSNTTRNEAMVMFASGCSTCRVFASLTEPNPISSNTAENNVRYNFFAGNGYPNGLYYFRIPRNTGRFYLSMLGTGVSNVQILLNVFPVPTLM